MQITGTASLSIDDLKAQIGILDSSRDTLLTQKLQAAIEYCDNITGYVGVEGYSGYSGYSGYPSTYKELVLIMAAELFKNPEITSTTAANRLPAFDMLLELNCISQY